MKPIDNMNLAINVADNGITIGYVTETERRQYVCEMFIPQSLVEHAKMGFWFYLGECIRVMSEGIASVESQPEPPRIMLLQ